MDKDMMNAMMKHHSIGFWWSKGRHAIIRRIIEWMRLPDDAQILEIGCGYGGNLSVLAEFGKLEAIEPDDDARVFASSFAGIDVYKGWLPDGLNCISGRSFNLICLLDVLEHVQDYDTTLRNIRQHLSDVAQGTRNKEQGTRNKEQGTRNKEQGTLLLTVPAYQWLWSKHDEKNFHFRRYSRRSLRQQLENAGYAVEYIGYMNTFLFLPMLLGRLLMKFSKDKDLDIGIKMPPRFINWILFKIFSFERHFIPRIALPFGGSVVAVCSKNPKI